MDKSSLPSLPTEPLNKTSATSLLKTLVGTVNLVTARDLAARSSMELHAWLVAKRTALGREITRVEMMEILARLSRHYFRPDFDRVAVNDIVDDFMIVLQGATGKMVADAALRWLSDGSNKFFPSPGGLLDSTLKAEISARGKDVAALDEALAVIEHGD